MRFKKNGMTVLACEPFNWLIEGDVTYIGVGDMGITKYFFLKDNVLTVEGISFKVDSMIDASLMVKKHTDAIGHDMEGSVYTCKPDNFKSEEGEDF